MQKSKVWITIIGRLGCFLYIMQAQLNVIN